MYQSKTELLVDFLSKDADAYLSSLVGHCLFFLFNILNTIYIVTFEFFVFNRKNKFSYFCLFSTVMQMCSCITSITRYNIQDPYGFYGQLGVVTGVFALVSFYKIYTELCFYWGSKKCTTIVFWGSNIFQAIIVALTFQSWDGTDNGFNPFRMDVFIANFYALLSLIIGTFAHKAGKIKFDPSFISAVKMNKIFISCLILQVLALALAGTSIKVLVFPATGLSFSILVIVTIFVPKIITTVATKGEESGVNKKTIDLELRGSCLTD